MVGVATQLPSSGLGSPMHLEVIMLSSLIKVMMDRRTEHTILTSLRTYFITEDSPKHTRRWRKVTKKTRFNMVEQRPAARYTLRAGFEALKTISWKKGALQEPRKS